MARTYTKEEVQAILSRAVERQHAQADLLSHEELVAVGRELGVSREAIDAAAREAVGGDGVTAGGAAAESSALGHGLGRGPGTFAEQVKGEVEVRVARTRRRFARHFVTYAMVMVLLATINLMTGGPLWFVWAALGWGIGVALHAMSALAPDRVGIEAKARKRIEREARRDGARVDAGVRVAAVPTRVAGEAQEEAEEEEAREERRGG
jgi:hypothetical protein